MEDETLEIVHLELKYCELCGGLWFRERDTECVHCEPCLEHLSIFPALLGRAGRPRLPKAKDGMVDEIGDLRLLVCSKGGNA